MSNSYNTPNNVDATLEQFSPTNKIYAETELYIEKEALNESNIKTDLDKFQFDESGNLKTFIDELVAWDDTTTANVIYKKYLSGKIIKINISTKTILTAQNGGTWANRATTNVYTEGGV